MFSTRDKHAPTHPERGADDRPARRPAPPLKDLVLGYVAGEQRLEPAEQAALARWIRAWLDQDPQRVFVMAECSQVGAGERADRLRAMRDTIQSLGVPRENIKYTEVVVDAPAAEQARHAARELLWLKSVDAMAAELFVRPVEAYFAGHRAH